MTQSAIFMQILTEVKERVLYDLSSLTQLMEADVIHGLYNAPVRMSVVFGLCLTLDR